MPLEAPVTRATLPDRGFAILGLLPARLHPIDLVAEPAVLGLEFRHAVSGLRPFPVHDQKRDGDHERRAEEQHAEQEEEEQFLAAEAEHPFYLLPRSSVRRAFSSPAFSRSDCPN